MGKAWRALNLVGDDDDCEDTGDIDDDGEDIGHDYDDDALSSRRSRLRQDASSLGAEHKLCWRLQVRYSKILDNNIWFCIHDRCSATESKTMHKRKLVCSPNLVQIMKLHWN